MSTTVCQRLPSQFDHRLVEPRAVLFNCPQTGNFAFTAKFALEQNPLDQQQDAVKKTGDAVKIGHCTEFITKKARNGSLGGWSFLQALSDTNQSSPNEDENIYVHPLAKRSVSALSERSLEMCTESLGSETGSSISENGDELLSSFSISEIEKSSHLPCYTAKKKGNSNCNFPPPLSTIRNSVSSGGVKVESLREDGRLVLKAVSVDGPQSCFEAERRDGRLTLHLVEDTPGSIVDENSDADECGFQEASSNQDFALEDDCVSDEDLGYDDDDDKEEEEERSVRNFPDGMEGENPWMPSRCKDEGGSRMIKTVQWEPLWVATS